MPTSPKISVIVPVYNVEKFIGRCIHSVLEQSFRDYELIVVNDCTPCNAISIVKAIMQENPDHRVTIIERASNGGLGAARNTGIAAAQGEFLFFLDSDDWLAPHALRKLYEHAEEKGSDIVAFSFYISTDDHAYPSATFRHLAPSADHRQFVLNYSPGAWNKLYRKYLFAENNILFPEKNQWYEDVATIPLIIGRSKTLTILDEPLLYYYQRADSIMGQTRKGNEKLFDIFKSVDRLVANKRVFSKKEWLELEQNLVFHTAAARLDDIAGIEKLSVRYRFIRRLYQQVTDTFPVWKTINAFTHHFYNYKGTQRVYYRRAFEAFAKGKLLRALFWTSFIKKESDMRQKVLFAIPTLHIGGAEKVFINMLQRIDYSKFNVTVYVYEQTGVFEQFIPKDKVKLIIRSSDNEQLYCKTFLEAMFSRSVPLKKKFLKCRMTMTNYLLSRNYSYTKFVAPTTDLPYTAYDVAVSYTDLTPSMTQFILGTNAGKKIMWIHNDFNPAFLDYIDDILFERDFSRFDNIVAVSSGAAASLCKRFPLLSKKTVVINNFLDSRDLQAKADQAIAETLDKGLVNLLSVGRIDLHTKGYDRIVPIAAKLRKDGFSFKWYILGDGPGLEKMRDLIKREDVEDVFFLLGARINPYPYIKNSDALVLPSRFEAYPTVVLEAHTLGTPCIVAKNSGTADQFRLIKDMVVENTEEALYEGLKRYLSDEALRLDMKARLHQYHYDNDIIIEKIEDLFGTADHARVPVINN